ncbi:MAG: AMP-binding protein [Planctomycetota bacterium]
MLQRAETTAPEIDLSDALPLSRLMLRACRRASGRVKLSDSTGDTLTGRQLLTKALVLRRLLLRDVLAPDEERVGVLIPPANGAAVVNAALALSKRVVVNLNYSASADVINACIKAAGLRHVLTTQKVLDKLGIELDTDVVLLDGLREKLTTIDKLAGATAAFAAPIGLLEKRLGLDTLSMDDLVTIIFTSGSTGVPKGVMLSHKNLVANIRSFDTAVRLRADDTILGILPFFHAFGYTVTLWAPLVLELGAAYHFNPLDARQVGKLCQRSGATILLSTPTFLRSFIKRVPVEDFASLELAIVGAEKLPMAVSEAFEKKFGVRPSEGYGATELAPVAAVNVPPSRSSGERPDSREGSIGPALPGVSARVVDPDTRVVRAIDEEGMLEIRGPNQMVGYLDQPEKTAEVVRDGWYVTGDIARIDADGFIHITGRQSRFSKIGGEMVPHVRVEEEIQSYVAGDDAEEQHAVVTAVPDERKGERLIVVHLPMDKSPAEVCEHLKSLGLPNLWTPSPDSFLQVDELPLLGSGKLDLKGLAVVAAEHFGSK